MTPTKTPAAAKELKETLYKIVEDAIHIKMQGGKEESDLYFRVDVAVEASPSSGLAEAVAKIETEMNRRHKEGEDSSDSYWDLRHAIEPLLAILKEQTGGSQA